MSKYDFTGQNDRFFECLIEAALTRIFRSDLHFRNLGGIEPTSYSMRSKPAKDKQFGRVKYAVIPLFIHANTNRKGGTTRLIKFLKKNRKTDELKEGSESEFDANPSLVIATNLNTESTANLEDAKETFLQLVNQHSSIKFQSLEIWDASTMESWLEENKEINQEFAPWLSKKDILKQSTVNNPQLNQALTEYLKSEFSTDKNVNLDQAGHSSEDQIALANVFVDLPATTTQHISPPDEEKTEIFGIVQKISEQSQHILRDDSISKDIEWTNDFDRQSEWPDREDAPPSGRMVLIGGPGQGKSTLTQLLCQIFRANLLNHKKPSLNPAEKNLLKQTQELQQELGIHKNLSRRFPFRIVLNDFAKFVGSNPENCQLETYLLEKIHKIIEKSKAPKLSKSVFSESEFLNWFCIYPQLLVLDGLDEVPPTSNRDEVLQVIFDFLKRVKKSSADLLVVATTRPQGYNRDFSEGNFNHYWLAPLSGERALSYSGKLVKARYPEDEPRQEKVIQRLERAVQYEQTCRLMQSPLQVTIMAVLVDRMGQPPQEKWNLFSEYYRIIYEREVERNIEASGILKRFRQDIDAIHHHVGLLLHIESEQSGKTDAKVERKILINLIEGRLSEEGHEGQELIRLSTQIIDAAMERLVFLVGVAANQIGFEIRSLQEFMAAQALMDGNDQVVTTRLTEIAPAIHWRNVFIFAAGCCFVKRQHLREKVCQICNQLNEKTAGRSSALTLAGSRLALEILEDGSANDQPKYRRQLTEISLQLTQLPFAETHRRLVKQLSEVSQNIVLDHIEKSFADSSLEENISHWILLGHLIDKEFSKSLELAKQYWKYSVEQQVTLLKKCGDQENIFEVQWFRKKFEAIVELISIVDMKQIIRGSNYYFKKWFLERDIQSEIAILQYCSNLTWTHAHYRTKHPLKFSKETQKLFPLNLKPFLRINLNLLNAEHWQHLLELNLTSKYWLPFKISVEFLEKKSEQFLGEHLEIIAQQYNFSYLTQIAADLPWVIKGAILISKNQSELNKIAKAIKAGKFGTFRDWIVAEENWEKEGFISIEHLIYDHILGQKDSLLSLLLPSLVFDFSSEKHQSEEFYSKYLTWISTKTPNPEHQKLKAFVSNVLFGNYRSGNLSSPKKDINYNTLLSSSSTKDGYSLQSVLDLIKSIQIQHLSSPGCLNFLDQLGKKYVSFSSWFILQISLREIHRKKQNKTLYDALLKQASENQEKTGLMRILCLLLRPKKILNQNIKLDFSKSQDLLYLETVVVIQLSQKQWSAQISEQLLFCIPLIVENNDQFPVFIVGEIIDNSELETHFKENFLTDLYSLFYPKYRTASESIIEHLNQIQAKKPSNLRSSKNWVNLQLPQGLNHLIDIQPEKEVKQAKAQKIKIHRLELTNIGGFKHIELDFNRDHSILIGLNGTGKTTVLRAILLAIIGYDEEISGDQLDSLLQIEKAEGGKRVYTKQGKILLQIDVNGKILENPIHFTMNPITAKLTIQGKPFSAIISENELKCLVLGLGQKHNLSLKSFKSNALESGPAKTLDLLPLLHQEERTILQSFVSWLVSLSYHAEKGEKTKLLLLEKIFEIFSDLTETKVELGEINIEDTELWIKSDVIPGGIPINLASQGYQVFMSWIGFLMKRMYEANEDFYPSWEANSIVLIDEIDSYMHPQWQSRIMQVLRKHFPNTQFIITTHSPLVVDQSEKGQVIELEQKAQGDLIASSNPVDIWAWSYQNIFEKFFHTYQDFEKYEEDLLPKIEKLEALSDRTEEQQDRLEQLQDSYERVQVSRAFADEIAAIKMRMRKKEKEFDKLLDQMKKGE